MKKIESGTNQLCKGQCLCGAVQFEIQGPMRDVVNCYCGQCRRVHGTLAAYTQALNTDLHIVKDHSLTWFRSSDTAERGFCQECGSSLFWKPINGERTSVSAGALDQPSGLKVSGHIYVSDLPDYHQIPDDGLPRFQTTSAGKLDGDLST